VLPELMRALPVAVLVGVAPGYFWARCLAPSTGWAGRIAYATALSMALVPTTALLLARILGTGVTLFIGASSVLAVFAAGFAAYLRFGKARYDDKPLFYPPPAPQGVYALAPLLAAFGLALGMALGLIPATLVALLVVLSLLMVAAVASPVSRPQEQRPSGAPRWWPLAMQALLLATLLIVLGRGYLGPVLHDWPFIRGGDQFSHAVMTNLMLTEGTTESYLIYPPGFHALAAVVSRFSGLEPLEVFAVLAPLLTALPPLACYALARRLWGQSYGVAAAFFSGVLLVGPFESFAEARYPNLVSADFLLVVAVAALIQVYSSPGVRSCLLLGALGSSVVLYHQVASFYLALLLALVAALSLPYLLLAGRKREALGLTLSLSLLGVLSVLYAWSTYDLPELVSGLAAGSDSGAGTAVAMAIGSQGPLSLEHLLQMTSQPVTLLGVLGALLVAGDLLRGRLRAAQRLAYLTLLLWAALLFIGSRTSLSGFPQRFERDLGIPLAILATLAFVTVVRSLRPRASRASLAGLVAFPAAALVLVAVGYQAVVNLGSADEKSSNVISADVATAGEWLGEHGTGGNIVVTPYLNDHVPGSAMLAMGGYSGLRSYTQKRLRVPRALPSTGKDSLLAAGWVLQHPESERTGSILDTYDIRFVTLYKRSPGVRLRAFEEHRDLYTKVFENDSVVIFAPV